MMTATVKAYRFTPTVVVEEIKSRCAYAPSAKEIARAIILSACVPVAKQLLQSHRLRERLRHHVT